MRKKDLKSLVNQANKILAETKGITLGFHIYANGNYILDTEEDNIIDIVWSEIDAIESITGIDEQSILESGKKSGCYYKPVLIDADNGDMITRKNISLYKRN